MWLPGVEELVFLGFALLGCVAFYLLFLKEEDVSQADNAASELTATQRPSKENQKGNVRFDAVAATSREEKASKKHEKADKQSAPAKPKKEIKPVRQPATESDESPTPSPAANAPKEKKKTKKLTTIAPKEFVLATSEDKVKPSFAAAAAAREGTRDWKTELKHGWVVKEVKKKDQRKTKEDEIVAEAVKAYSAPEDNVAAEPQETISILRTSSPPAVSRPLTAYGLTRPLKRMTAAGTLAKSKGKTITNEGEANRRFEIRVPLSGKTWEISKDAYYGAGSSTDDYPVIGYPRGATIESAANADAEPSGVEPEYGDDDQAPAMDDANEAEPEEVAADGAEM